MNSRLRQRDSQRGGGEEDIDSPAARASSSSLSPIFAITRDDRWRIPGQRHGSIRLVASGGGLLAIATSDNQLLLWRPNETSSNPAESVDFTSTSGSRMEGGRIHSVSVDPSGKHVLMCITTAGSGTCYYCPYPPGISTAPQARELSSLRGFIIESVAWPSFGNASSSSSTTTPAAGKGKPTTTIASTLESDAKTGPFLLGTSTGKILSCRIEDKKEKNLTRLFDTAVGVPGGGGGGANNSELSPMQLPITGLKWESYGPTIPAASSTTSSSSSAAAATTGGAPGEPSKHFVVAVTSGKALRYYEFSGGPSVEAAFGVVSPIGGAISSSSSSKGQQSLVYHEIRGGAIAGAEAVLGAGNGAIIDASSSSSRQRVNPDVQIQYHTEASTASSSSTSSSSSSASSQLMSKGSSSSSSSSSSAGIPGRPESVTFLTGIGLFTSRVQISTLASACALVEPKMLPYPAFSTSSLKEIGGDRDDAWSSSSSRGGGNSGAVSSSTTTPLPAALAVTPFHYVLVYKQRVVAVSRVSHSIIFEQAFGDDRHGTLRGTVVDTSTAIAAAGISSSAAAALAVPSLYMFSDKYIFKITVSDEARDVWKLYLARHDFASAKKFARKDEMRLRRVDEAEAEYMFASGRFQEAAVAFAGTKKPFEETCLRFIAGGHREALQSYLLLVLDDLRTRPAIFPLQQQQGTSSKGSSKSGSSSSSSTINEKDRTNAPQRSILCTWLLEMYLDRLNLLHPAAVALGGKAEDEYNGVAAQLRNFLREHIDEIDRNTALALMSGYGRTAELLFYCRLIGEWGRVVAHHISRGEWLDAIEAIHEAPSSSGGGLLRGPGGAVKGDANSQEELWYRHSSVLMPVMPAETVDGWKECSDLDPARLIPTLVRYEQVRNAAAAGTASPSAAVALPPEGGRNNASSSSLVSSTATTTTTRESLAATLDMALVYLEWVVEEGILGRKRDSRSRAVHNLLLSLYAAQPLEEPLLHYLDEQMMDMDPAPPAGAALCVTGSGGGGPSMALQLAQHERDTADAAAGLLLGNGVVADADEEQASLSSLPFFDIMYALRVCLNAKKKRACVRLYTAMGLYIEAVDLALTVDVELAKTAAARPLPEEIALRKRLWTRVAVHVVASGGGAHGALEVMEESNGCLKIEDVLMYFPGITMIGDFKTEVTESLREADATIATLRSEMKDYTKAAECIRSDIKALRNRCGSVRVGQRCDVCRDPVLARHFYLFPCAHAFHEDCLLAEMMKHLNAAQKKRVGDLRQSVQRMQALLNAATENGTAYLSSSAAAGELSSFQISPPDSRVTAADVRTLLVSKCEDMQAELDRYVAGECLYCGEVMIKSLADPLGTDYAEENDHFGGGSGGGSGYDEWSI